MQPDDLKNVLGQLFAGGTALAGLVLVFLGGILASYESYDPADRSAVKAQYKRRAWAAFWGFVGSLIAGAAGMVGLLCDGSRFWLISGLVALTASAIVLIGMAVLSVQEIA